MNRIARNRIRQLLQTALPPTRDPESDPVPPRDLWPELHRRIAAEPAAQARTAVPWFDWAIAGAVALVAVTVPAAVPLLLYYL